MEEQTSRQSAVDDAPMSPAMIAAVSFIWKAVNKMVTRGIRRPVIIAALQYAADELERQLPVMKEPTP